VWLTSDKELVVAHGGYSGEINFGIHADEDNFHTAPNYIFETTLAANREIETNFILPTLEEVICATNKRAFLNIEIKCPENQEIFDKYDMKHAVRKVFEAIQAANMNEYCVVSSFDERALAEMERVSHSEFYQVRTIYLENYYTDIPCLPIEKMITRGDGCNIEVQHLTKEIIDTMHTHGKIVMVWVDCTVTSESYELHKKLMSM